MSENEAHHSKPAGSALAALENLTPEMFVRLPAVQLATGMSRSSIYRGMQTGTFPRHYRIGSRARGWRWGDILGWLSSRQVAAPETK